MSFMPLLRKKKYRPNHAGLYVPAAGGAAATTWNPADKGNSFVLSNGNLTATASFNSPGGFGGRSVAGKSSGKYYWEIRWDLLSSGSPQTGVAIAGWDEDSSMLNTANGAVVRNDGLCGYNSSNAVISGFVVNDVVGIALDLTNSKIWFRTNSGGWQNDIIANQDPASNIGGRNITGIGTVFACAYLPANLGNTVTARFDSGSWGFSAPSGFGPLS